MKVTRQNIIQLMEDEKVSQNELSRRTGIAASTLNRYIKHGADIPITNARSIAHALGVTLAELSGDTVTLSNEEHEIIEHFRMMPIPLKHLLLVSARAYAEVGK